MLPEVKDSDDVRFGWVCRNGDDLLLAKEKLFNFFENF